MAAWILVCVILTSYNINGMPEHMTRSTDNILVLRAFPSLIAEHSLYLLIDFIYCDWVRDLLMRRLIVHQIYCTHTHIHTRGEEHTYVYTIAITPKPKRYGAKGRWLFLWSQLVVDGCWSMLMPCLFVCCCCSAINCSFSLLI